MSYEIEIVDLDPQPVLVIEAETAPQDLGATLGEIFGRVHHYIAERGSVTGMPFMRYLDMTDRFSIDAGMPNPAEIPGEGDISNKVLPGGRTATAVYLGPYDGVGAAWDAMFAWYAERTGKNGFVAGGWDLYENDPDTVSDTSQLRTRIYLPLDE